jgi:hypothetical protein
MRFLKILPTVFCAALLSTTFAPTASADDWDKKTTVTFSSPIEIPGVHLQGWGVLPAGTYVFKLLDSRSDRHIVQIFNADESVIYATILAIPHYRVQATDKTVITFNEGIQDRPEALRAWFYPGRNWGEEFVYPKAKAMEIAAITKTPVLFTPHSVGGRASRGAVEASADHGDPAHGRTSGTRRSSHSAAARRASRDRFRADPGAGGEPSRDSQFTAIDRPLRNTVAWRSAGRSVNEKSRYLNHS